MSDISKLAREAIEAEKRCDKTLPNADDLRWIYLRALQAFLDAASPEAWLDMAERLEEAESAQEMFNKARDFARDCAWTEGLLLGRRQGRDEALEEAANASYDYDTCVAIRALKTKKPPAMNAEG